MRKAFNMDYMPQIESGDYTVTCDGKPIQIVKWDCKGPCPILGVMDDSAGIADAVFFTEEGHTLNEKFWLYVEIPNNYNEVEQAIESLLTKVDSDYGGFMMSYGEYIEMFAPAITKAAEDMVRPTCREKIYEDMPRWRKSPECDFGEEYVISDCGEEPVLAKGHRYLVISELENLFEEE